MNVLLGQFNLPGQHNIFAAGGTTGNGTPTNASDYPLPFPHQRPAAGAAPHQRSPQRQLCHQRGCHRRPALPGHRRRPRSLRPSSASAA